MKDLGKTIAKYRKEHNLNQSQLAKELENYDIYVKQNSISAWELGNSQYGLRKRVRVRFLFTGGSAKGLLGTVNEQRQGITMTVVSCLFALRNQVRFVRTWSSPYMARLGVVAAYVRTGSLYTSDKV